MNKTSPFAYAMWAILTAVFMLVIGVHYHPSWEKYAVGGAIWVIGILAMMWQIIKDGDTTAGPYLIQTAGALTFGIWSATS